MLGTLTDNAERHAGPKPWMRKTCRAQALDALGLNRGATGVLGTLLRKGKEVAREGNRSSRIGFE